MCGIAGILRKEGAHPGDEGHMREMLLKQSHRGPDASELCSVTFGVLGHNRLSIIDLSSDANQPFSYEHLTLVFNGEIYNFAELRLELESQGHLFQTKSDTEVLLTAYAEWDVGCLERLNGMFAFALYDSFQQKILLARDCAREKPLFYYIHGSTLFFASELKALLAHTKLPRQVNNAALDCY